MGGTASSGVIICFLRIITKAALPATRAGLRSSTALYFALSGLLSLSCFVVYHSVLPRLGIVQYYRQKRQEGKANSTHHAHCQHCLALDALMAASCRPMSSLPCQRPPLSCHVLSSAVWISAPVWPVAALELSPQPSLLEAEGALHGLHEDDQVSAFCRWDGAPALHAAHMAPLVANLACTRIHSGLWFITPRECKRLHQQFALDGHNQPC